MFLPLKELIDNGSLSVADPIVNEQKEVIIDILHEYHHNNGVDISKTLIGLLVDKVFDEEFDGIV